MPTLTGTDGNDTLTAFDAKGQALFDDIDALAGDDTIIAAGAVAPGAGNDVITGNGQTLLKYFNSPSGVVVNFAAGIAFDGWGGTDSFTGIGAVGTSNFDDVIIGSEKNEEVLVGGQGRDMLDMGAGIDKLRISIRDGWTYSLNLAEDGRWVLEYGSTDTPRSASISMTGVEVVEINNGRWELSHRFELTQGHAAEVTPAIQAAPTLRTDFGPASHYWAVQSGLLYQTAVTDIHGSGYYPTPSDTFGPSPWVVDLLHNALAGEFDGQPGQDLLLNVAWFPHLLEHQPVKPILFVHYGDGLALSATFSDAVQKGRQFIYRTELADYNSDGRLDFLSSNMGTSVRTSAGQSYDLDQPYLAMMSTAGGGWVDATQLIKGQEAYSQPGGTNVFGHDFAAGDVNGDGRIDVITGGHLLVNLGGGSFVLDNTLLGAVAKLRTEPSFVMSSVLADFNGDGLDDLAFWIGDNGQADKSYLKGYFALNQPGSGFALSAIQVLPAGVYGQTNTKFNFAIAGDLNHDGVPEVVLGETRISPYYQGRSVQLMSFDGNTLIDRTTSRLAPDPRSGLETQNPSNKTGSGEGQIFLVDVNGDGHLDIVDTGTRVMLNDGEGYFVDLPASELPKVSSTMLSGWAYTGIELTNARLVPVDLDGRNGIDWVGQVTQPPVSSSPLEIHPTFLWEALSTARYGKAGGGQEGAAMGAPGFDEAYYLRRHPEVAAQIQAGAYASALDHFLRVGKAQGFDAFAPYTVVWGSDRGDSLRLQSADERYIGGAGADSVAGLAGDDSLEGGGGDDTLDGGLGTDTAVYRWNAESYILQLAAGGKASVAFKAKGGISQTEAPSEGADTLTDVELLTFANRTLHIDSHAHASYADLPDSLYQFFMVGFAAAPGVTYMDQMAEAYRFWLPMYGQGTVARIVEAFTTKTQFTNVYPQALYREEGGRYFEFSHDYSQSGQPMVRGAEVSKEVFEQQMGALARVLVDLVVKNSATAQAKNEAVQDLKSALLLGGTWTIGKVIYTVFGNLAAKATTDPIWGGTGHQFSNQLAVAKMYTDVLSQSTTDISTLRAVMQSVTEYTDVTTSDAITTLIGVALTDPPPGG